MIKGYDENGLYRSETINGVNGSIATGSITFNEIISVNSSNDTSGSIQVGTQSKSVVFEPSAITITPAGTDTGDKYTVVGLDQFGNTQTEAFTAGAAGINVTSTKVFQKSHQ